MTEQSNAGTKTGQGVGDAIKGIFNAGHGAGETIRGTINDTLDQFGKGVTSGGSQNTNTVQTASGENHASTVEKGKQEFNQGVNDLSNTGK